MKFHMRSLNHNMRPSNNNLLYGLLIYFHFTIFAMSKRFNKKQLVERFERIIFPEYEDVIFRKSNHYYYTLEVSRYKFLPLVLLDHHKYTETSHSFQPKFPILYYGAQYDTVTVKSNGEILIGKGQNPLIVGRKITAFNGISEPIDMEILNSERLISIGWVNLRTSMSNTQEFSNNRAKVYCYIFSNGKITIFYENIPIEMEDKLGDLSISDGFKYNQMNEVPKGLVYSRIQIPTSMVKSGTLVELMPTKEFCSNKPTRKNCTSASTPRTRCYWCESIGQCSNGYDIHTGIWMQNGCRNIHNFRKKKDVPMELNFYPSS